MTKDYDDDGVEVNRLTKIMGVPFTVRIPKGRVNSPLALAKCPFIKEKLISGSAEVTDDEGKTVILLTSILE